jgi:predicted MPP superfamily phosphohydrolase
MAKKKRNTPQFDVEKSLRDRRLEKIIFRHGTLATVIKTIGFYGLSALIWPRWIAPQRWKLTRFDVSMNQLPAAFDGYQIAQLTDLHTGSTQQRYLAGVLETVVSREPNLIVITGDLIEYRAGSLEKLSALLSPLHAPDGVVAILGNHDYHEYSWRHVGPRSAHRAIHKRLRKLLDRHHIELLCNQHRVIRRGNAELYIVGMDELWTGNADGDTAFNGVAPGAACICLQHNPDGFEILRDYPWQLMLCGHTHGGQVNLPLAGSLFVPMKHRQYLRGWYRSNPSPSPGGQAIPSSNAKQMYVSTGLGQSVPIRLRVPPEATIFTLRSRNVSPTQ